MPASGFPAVDSASLEKALTALVRFGEKQGEGQTQLFEDAGNAVTLELQLTNIPEGKGKHKPQLIPVPHPLYTEDSEICLFVKDPQRKYKDIFAKHKVPGLVKIVGMTKLKKNYKEFYQKRQLCNSFDLFLADERVIEMMPTYLGKYFWGRNKIPVPVKIVEKDPVPRIQTVLGSTFFRMPSGPSIGIRIGWTTLSVQQLRENAVAVLEAARTLLPADNPLQSIQVRVYGAPTLVVWRAKVDAVRAHPTERRSGAPTEVGNAAKKAKTGGDKAKGRAVDAASGASAKVTAGDASSASPKATMKVKKGRTKAGAFPANKYSKGT